MPFLTTDSRGAQIAVRAIPRAGRSGIAGTRGDALLVRLAAAPVDGAANEELLAVLAGALGIPKRQLSVIAGERARDKRVLVEGASIASLEARLSNILGSSGPPGRPGPPA
jgi:uncharacterized protein YggU (UPF0235/DUF167 family)